MGSMIFLESGSTASLKLINEDEEYMSMATFTFVSHLKIPRYGF